MPRFQSQMNLGIRQKNQHLCISEEKLTMCTQTPIQKDHENMSATLSADIIRSINSAYLVLTDFHTSDGKWGLKMCKPQQWGLGTTCHKLEQTIYTEAHLHYMHTLTI